MCLRIIRGLLVVLGVFSMSVASGFAQATFSVGTDALTAADIGQTELTGSLFLTVVSGTTVAAPFVITYSAPITNNAATEIYIMGTGALFAIAPNPVIDQSNNSLIINVPSGGAKGASILISGVRVAIDGLDLTQVTATVVSPSASGNAIVSGQNNLLVIRNVEEPFAIDQSVSPPLSFRNGLPVNPNSFFDVTEGFYNAFTSSVGIAGQTVPSQIRITPFPFIPEGVKITFSPTAASTDTGATLTTLSGSAETVPRLNGSTDVIYQFTSAVESATTIESFRIYISMALDSPSGTETIRFQAMLLPIGLAVPTKKFPSTAIPRYAERLVPDETELQDGFTELLFPFHKESDDIYTGVAITNPGDYRVLATLTAYDIDGSLIDGDDIENPVSITLPRKGQFAQIASDIFGPGFDSFSSGAIRVSAKTSELEGLYLVGDVSGSRLDGGTGDIRGARSWYLPVIFKQGLRPYNRLQIYNPGDSEATLTLMLFDASGGQVASATRKLPANGTLVDDVTDMFNTDLESFEGGYITGQSDFSLVIHNAFGNALESNVLKALPSLPVGKFYIPHFAEGGQYSTELTIVDTSYKIPAELTLTLLDDSGATLPINDNPVKVTIAARAQWKKTLADLFPALGPDLTTGSIRIESKIVNFGPFGSSAPLMGAVRFSSTVGSASATIPLILDPAPKLVYSHVAQDLGYFTGLVVQNTNEESADLTIDVYSKDGMLVGSYSSVLEPGERFAKLLYELIPASEGQIGGYIRIESDAALTSFALFGGDDLKFLGAIPPQRLQ